MIFLVYQGVIVTSATHTSHPPVEMGLLYVAYVTSHAAIDWTLARVRTSAVQIPVRISQVCKCIAHVHPSHVITAVSRCCCDLVLL